MQKSNIIILLALAVAGVQTVQLVIALRTGRARGRGNWVTRKGQPRRFWTFVYADFAMLLLCIVAVLWALISPT